jgi:hypothetical protein
MSLRHTAIIPTLQPLLLLLLLLDDDVMESLRIPDESEASIKIFNINTNITPHQISHSTFY